MPSFMPRPPAPPRPASSQADPMLGRTVRHYRLDERLGQGGMGVVYRAHDLALGRDAALKFLPPALHADAAARERLLKEARAASALDHAHVASVYEIGEAEDGRLFLAMAYYDGQTVAEAIAQGPLPIEHAVDIALQAGAGLARAHRAGIVHCDVKPANLIVTADGVVKVLDFGIATAEGADASAGSTSGSAPYMSPEQAEGRPTDSRTDVWGLGVTLYEVLTGQAAFSGAFTTAVLYSVLHTEPRPVEELRPDLPAPLGAVVARCLAKDPADRYPDVATLLDDLRPVLAPPSQAPGGAGWLGGVLRTGRLRVLLSVAVPLVGAAIAWGLWPSGPSEQHVVVLPFTASGGAEAEELADGLLETITGRLSQLEQFGDALWVIPASEVTSGMTLTDAREQLGATLAVGGAVQVEDGRVRLLLTLSDTDSRRQLASGVVDVGGGSALAVQDQAVLQIARMLEVEVEPQARNALLAGGTDNAEANAYYLRGQGALRDQQSLDDVEKAAALFRQAIRSDPEFALAHASLGRAMWAAYQLTGNTEQADEAIEHSDRALSLDATLAPVHVSLAAIYAGRQEYGRALDAVDRAIEIDPTSAEAIHQRASVLQDLGRFYEAEAAHKRAIQLESDYWRRYYSLGTFYYNTGRFDEAVEVYQKARTLAPSNLTVLNGLAATMWELGNLRQAAATFKRILRVDPEHPYAEANLGTALFYLGDFEQSAEHYSRVSRKSPDNAEFWMYLGDAQWWTPGRRAQARASYRSSIAAARRQLAIGPSPETLATLAGAHAKLGSRDSALAYLDDFIALRDPSQFDPGTAFHIGEVYEIMGNRSSAIEWVRAGLDGGYGGVILAHSPWLRLLRDSLDPAHLPSPNL